MHHNFQVNKLYNRQRDIHDRFGGSRQSGIATSAQFPYIFLFAGKTGPKYGYKDEWDENGIFKLTGEGQLGDMSFTKGNLAVRDHVKNGKDLLLFQGNGHGKPYQFIGEFVCNSYEIDKIPDREKNIRNGIIFHLVPISDEPYQEIDMQEDFLDEDIKTLRTKAINAAQSATKRKSSTSQQTNYNRSAIIAKYVLRRANGVCECCGAKAPFLKKSGEPYLEPHHIRKLSDNGLDHPEWVAAITPNCHREIHYGQNGLEKNKALKKKIRALEKSFNS